MRVEKVSRVSKMSGMNRINSLDRGPWTLNSQSEHEDGGRERLRRVGA